MTSVLEQPFDSSIVGWEVAISVSEPDPEELAARGVSKAHVDHAFKEIARQLLAAGATLAYGGDFRRGGYTERLIGILNEYADGRRPEKECIRQYLAWPIWETSDATDRAKLNRVATVLPGPPPEVGAADPAAFDPVASPAARAVWADSLTRMRERMTEAMSARVVLGGRLVDHRSRFPGLVEEAFLAARARKPLYVLGGFGGCASCLAQLVRGQRPAALTQEWQLDRTRGYEQLLEGVGAVDWETMLDTIHRSGPGRVPNGLSDEENEVLLDTADLDLVVALVLRGLRALALSR